MAERTEARPEEKKRPLGKGAGTHNRLHVTHRYILAAGVPLFNCLFWKGDDGYGGFEESDKTGKLHDCLKKLQSGQKTEPGGKGSLCNDEFAAG